MVRAALACARCRKSKVKCIHDGSPPCRHCVKSGPPALEACVLSRPESKNKRPQASPNENNQPNLQTARTPSLFNPINNAPHSLGPPQDPRDTTVGSLNDGSSGSEASHNFLWSIPASMVLQAASMFSIKLPELAFLHIPSFSQCVKHFEKSKASKTSPGSKSPVIKDHSGGNKRLCLLGAALIALCARFLDSNTRADEYASCVRDNLSVVDPPDIYTIQTLLVIAMYEWGNGNGYRAWMYSGMAMRMMQSLTEMTKPDSLVELQQEIHNRTFWSCFIIDRSVFCGKSQPLTLPLESMDIPWPLGEQDFAFGQSSGPRYIANHPQSLPLDAHNTIDYYYSILVRGFDIWARILKWVIGGGRRQSGMCNSRNCPWVAGSPWRALYDELQAWRQRQNRRICYPETGVEIHVSLGQGESFAFVNLIYYISLLFLGREYIPFLPTPDSEPSGPTDAPLLEAEAPQGWWTNRAAELFFGAAHITSISQQLDEANASLLTPFAGFCNFAAATMNIYVSCFPNMNHGRSREAEAMVSSNIDYLDRFKALWPMGSGWCRTVEHTQILYQRASHDRTRFRGKTRVDFLALEGSMHDYAGNSPIHAEVLPAETPPLRPRNGHGIDHHAEAAISLQELSHSHVRQQEQTVMETGLEGDVSAYDHWNEIWPLWGEQQSIPFAVGGIPFDYNLDLLSQ